MSDPTYGVRFDALGRQPDDRTCRMRPAPIPQPRTDAAEHDAYMTMCRRLAGLHHTRRTL